MSAGSQLPSAVGRSGYRPNPFQMSPLFRWPPHVGPTLKWLFGFPGYLWPWNTLIFGIAAGCYLYLVPQMDRLKELAPGWISLTLFCNLMLLVVFASAWHLQLYVRKGQGMEFKYAARWLAVNNPGFLFKDQLWDNVFWSLCSAVPVWTAYEVLTLWMQANHFIPTVSFESSPVCCLVLALVTPLWIQMHFYAFHRFIHLKPLYTYIHYIHHKNVNFGPWSGLAMHPIEHILLFSAVILFWIVPAHPINVLFLLVYLGIAPTISHSGFARLVFTDRVSLDVGDYMHYLHHKYVRVNYGGGDVPLDKWFGTFHDGSEEADEALRRQASIGEVRA